ncbi:hypothetical protein GW17_00061832, partial [Ensete ventricosum]
ALAKAAELRALHAALLQGGNGGGGGGIPAVATLPAGASRPANRFSVSEDYPVVSPVSCAYSFGSLS